MIKTNIIYKTVWFDERAYRVARWDLIKDGLTELECLVPKDALSVHPYQISLNEDLPPEIYPKGVYAVVKLWVTYES